MRTLLILVILGALGWSGYWWAGATAQRTAIGMWLEDRRAAGWVADSSSVTVRGYPNRFDTIVQNLSLADPVSAWSWDAPEFQILALSYQPNHIIAVWPGTQVLSSPGQRIDLTAQRMRGSVTFFPSTALALKQTIIELDAVALASTRGWTAGLSSGQLAFRRSAPDTAPDFGYDFSLTGRSLTLPEPLKRAIDPSDLLPPTLATADVRLTPVFDAEWNLAAVEGRKPRLITLNIDNVKLAWGNVELGLQGRVDRDDRGYAEGSVNVIARNWQDMLKLAVESGMVSENLAGTLGSALGFLAQGTGETDLLDITLTMERGFTRVGPIPIGPAPRMDY